MTQQEMETLRSVFELVYFASGPILALLAIWGLKQITITKNNAQMSAKREAFRLSAEQCSKFMETIIPKMNAYDEISKTIKWDWIDKAKVEILDDGFRVNTPAESFDEANIRPRLSAALDVINSL